MFIFPEMFHAAKCSMHLDGSMGHDLDNQTSGYYRYHHSAGITQLEDLLHQGLAVNKKIPSRGSPSFSSGTFSTQPGPGG